MGLLDSLTGLAKTADKANAKKKLEEALTNAEYRRNVFRTDEQRNAAFYFSDENEQKEKSKGCFSQKTEKEDDDIGETKPYFEDDKKGCFGKKSEHSMSDAEYEALRQKIIESQNFKQKALEALLLDESEVKEIEPIHFGYGIIDYNDENTKLRIGQDYWTRSSKWQETWIFFSKTSLLAYQCEFYMDRNDKKETTYEYQYKDITSVKVIESTEEIIDKTGKHPNKSCKFEICVPGDSLTCTFSNNDEQVNSVKAMKATIRDKKNN